VLVFQPHRYTRTRDLMDDFARVLSQADTLFVTEVYAAGEAPIAVLYVRAAFTPIATEVGAMEWQIGLNATGVACVGLVLALLWLSRVVLRPTRSA